MSMLDDAQRIRTPAEGCFERGELIIDFAARSVLRRGQVIHLTPTEFRLLALLAHYVDRVLTSRQILTLVWGAEYQDQIKILRTHINRLRMSIQGA